MASAPGNRKGASVPPKRGKIKAQIFESLVETMTSAASKAGEALSMMVKRGGGGEDGSRSGSASTSPPDSAYPSDGYNDHA